MLINDEKHYVTLNNYLRSRFNSKVFRISLNAGLSCPNRDKSPNNIGCLYCSSNLSGDFGGNKEDSFFEQFKSIKEIMEQKWHDGLYIAYLQAGSNTYADINKLKGIYSEVIDLDEKIVILSIATRPDCINEEIISLLKEIQQKKEIWIELGFQTMHEDTAILINRGYQNNKLEDAINLLKKYGITTFVGGIFTSTNEEYLFSQGCIDYVIPGVSTLPLYNLFKELYKSKIKRG